MDIRKITDVEVTAEIDLSDIDSGYIDGSICDGRIELEGTVEKTLQADVEYLAIEPRDINDIELCELLEIIREHFDAESVIEAIKEESHIPNPVLGLEDIVLSIMDGSCEPAVRLGTVVTEVSRRIQRRATGTLSGNFHLS